MIPQWPLELLKEDGSCVNLLDDNSCAIYEERPMICRVDEMMELMGADKDFWYKTNADHCNTWMDEDGVEGKRVEL
jgi:Fe-S-cluster containining protein